MSAIEIMDPRMDTGMTIEHTFESFDTERRRSPEDTLGIMDRLIVREMAWISGHSLAQTVYTCIYFHHIKKLNELPMPTLTSNMDDIIYGVLRSYILATVKCCHYIWTEMTQGNVYEVNNAGNTHNQWSHIAANDRKRISQPIFSACISTIRILMWWYSTISIAPSCCWIICWTQRSQVKQLFLWIFQHDIHTAV